MLLTKSIEQDLPMLGEAVAMSPGELVLMVRFFDPYSNWVWYGVEYDPLSRIFFGYVEGFVNEWGDFSLDELEEVGRIERDRHWQPKMFKDYMKST